MDEPRFDSLEHRLRSLETRLRAIESRLSLSPGPPEPPGAEPRDGPDPEALHARVQHLGERVYALEAHAPAKMAERLLGLEARLAELERPREEEPRLRLR